jgi:hypothetical protein
LICTGFRPEFLFHDPRIAFYYRLKAMFAVIGLNH